MEKIHDNSSSFAQFCLEKGQPQEPRPGNDQSTNPQFYVFNGEKAWELPGSQLYHFWS